MKTETELPAFKITMANGDHFVTNMSAGITLEMATKYYLGRNFTYSDESTSEMVRVEQL